MPAASFPAPGLGSAQLEHLTALLTCVEGGPAFEPHTIWSLRLSTADHINNGPGHQPSALPQSFMELVVWSLRANATPCEMIDNMS